MCEDLARRSHAVLKRALGFDADARAAFIESACADDRALLDRVRALALGIDETIEFLEVPALGTAPGGGAEIPIEPGHVVGGYRIIRVIGVGGMAIVYEAEQSNPARRVALKILKHSMAQTSALQRFRYETEILAKLKHPGIAHVYDAGICKDDSGQSAPYIAMEHIEGAQRLTEFADEQGLDLRRRLLLLADVCDAVQHGHRHGVIHRDLKPSNVLVDPTGCAKVIDFGVARSTDPQQAWITKEIEIGRLVGTLHYMSPEQCGAHGEVDVRADVYSLGVMLYELVCGRLPHDLTRVMAPEALRIIQEDAPKKPSSIDTRLKGDIEAIILKAIDKDPDRRYRSAEAMGEDIRRHCRNETIEARPPTLVRQGRLFARRHRVVVAATGAIVMVMLIATVLSAGFGVRAVRESRLRMVEEKKAMQERDAALWQAYIANIAASLSAFQSGEFHTMRRRLEDAPTAGRGWEWRFLSALADVNVRTIVAADDMIYAFAMSRDRERFATGSRDGSFRLWDTRTGDPQALIEPGEDRHTQQILTMAFSPGGSHLVTGSADRTVRVWETTDGALSAVNTGHSAIVESVQFEDDGTVISASSDGVALRWRVDTGELVRVFADQPKGVTGTVLSSEGQSMLTWNSRGEVWVRDTGDASVEQRFEFPGSVSVACFNEDASLIVAGGNNSTVLVWDRLTGELLHTFRVENTNSLVRTLVFTPGGRHVIAGLGARIIVVWNVETGAQETILRGHEETVSGLGFTPGGDQLLSSSWDRTVRRWTFVDDKPAPQIKVFEGHTGNVISVRFSPRGDLLASASSDQTVRLWDPEIGDAVGVLRGHTGQVFALEFSPDGRWLVSGAYDGDVRIWDTTSGKTVQILKGHAGGIWSVAFSPDGRWLASGGSDRVIRIWNLDSMTLVRVLEGHTARVNTLAFSPDGSLLASGSQSNSVRLWDAATGGALAEMEGHTADVFSVVFSADGSVLYSGSRDQTVRIWDVDSGESTGTLEGHGQIITSLSISPDQTRLVAGSWFGQIVMWDIASRDVVASFKGHHAPIRSVRFGPTGRWLASASYDRTVRLFDTQGQRERSRRMAAAIADSQRAASVIDQLLATYNTIDRVLEAVQTGQGIDSELVPEVRKQLLRHSLQDPFQND